MQLIEAVLPFFSFLQFEKRFSQHTIIAYKTDIEQFIAFLNSHFQVVELDEVHSVQVRTWLANLKDQGISARSINRKISTLKSFYKYLMRQGIVKVSPLSTLSGPKSGKKLPSWVDAGQMETLLERSLYPDDWEGHTAFLAILILYETGLRRSELIGLKVGQVDFHNNTIRVLGKGNKERILPVRVSLLAEIKNYLDAKKISQEGGGSHVLTREDGLPVTAPWVYAHVKKYLSLITTQEKKSPHVLRHSFATHLTNAGADLNAVKELLGHSSLAATQVYTHNSIEKLKKVHGQAHPKG